MIKHLTEWRAKWGALPGNLRRLSHVLVVIALLGAAFALITSVATFFSGKLYENEFCVRNECVGEIFKLFDQGVLILNATLQLLVGIATVGGIFVALLSYTTTASNEALTNHIAHLEIFRDYVLSEVAKRSRISVVAIDVMHLYNMIFALSRSGRTDVADTYRSFVNELNQTIELSNKQSVSAASGSFRYKPHQERMRAVLMKAGISVEFAPRNDFFEMEAELLSLIQRINQSFCFSGNVPDVAKRKYF